MRLCLGHKTPSRDACARWADVSPVESSRASSYGWERVLAVGAACDEALARARDVVLAYDIYPAERLLARVCTKDGRLVAGAIVVQRIRFGPVRLEVATRVTRIIDEKWRTGFEYVTLQGHVEAGRATFLVERVADVVIMRILAKSRPAGLARLAPRLALRLQGRAVAAALDHVARRVKGTSGCRNHRFRERPPPKTRT